MAETQRNNSSNSSSHPNRGSRTVRRLEASNSNIVAAPPHDERLAPRMEEDGPHLKKP